MARRAFYSFHYKPDNWRASNVRNIGAVEGNRPATDNDWEAVKKGGESEIRKWIDSQLYGRSCTIVLVGANTAKRKWIDYEIMTSWNDGMGVLGIHVNGLKDSEGSTSAKGANPFDHITIKSSGKSLSSIIHCYTPTGSTSKDKYDWIRKHLASKVEEAIDIRASQ